MIHDTIPNDWIENIMYFKKVIIFFLSTESLNSKLYNYHFVLWSFVEDEDDSALLLFYFIGHFGARDPKNFS